MRRLTGRDSGAVAVVVAILVPTIFIAFAVLVLDVGQLYGEKRKLQNASDSAALAVAKTCALAAGTGGSCDSSTSATGTANAVGAMNYSVLLAGTTIVDQLCGGNSAPGLPACVPPAGSPGWDCPATTGSLPYVQVYTSTRRGGGSTLPRLLARALPGGGGDPGSTVHACARAVYGAPASLTSTLPLTISKCEFNGFTASGTSYAPPPPYPPYPAEDTLFLHDTTGSSHCPAGPSGADLPGGFGWLQTSTDCNTASSVGNWFNDSTGRPPPNSCDVAELAALVGHTVAVPIYSDANGLTGTNGKYYIERFAAFFLTGYSINGQFKETSIATGRTDCSGVVANAAVAPTVVQAPRSPTPTPSLTSSPTPSPTSKGKPSPTPTPSPTASTTPSPTASPSPSPSPSPSAAGGGGAGSQSCIFGFFTTGTVTGTPGGAPNGGVSVVGLSG